MDSLPQELINAIIDNISSPSLRSSSLVARRWRHRSQQRAFKCIVIESEHEAHLWCKNISQESDGISSFVHFAHFISIPWWNEPALFGRVLKGLTSLTSLWVFDTGIPDELQDCISRGELGKEITTLGFLFPLCTHATMMSLVLSLPNLKKLVVQGNGLTSEELLPMHTATPCGGPLDRLQLRGDVNGVGETLVKYQFMSRRLILDLSIPCAEQLIVLSAETVVELQLYDTATEDTPPPIHIPSLPALATLDVELCAGGPSPHLTSLLCSISSAPVLTSITVGSDEWSDPEHPVSSLWVEMDQWLTRTAEHAGVDGSLRVTLKRWPEGKSARKEFLRRFREAGGKLMGPRWHRGNVRFLTPGDAPSPLHDLPATPQSVHLDVAPPPHSLHDLLANPQDVRPDVALSPPSLHDLLASPQGSRLDVAFPPHPDRLRIHQSHLSMAATHPPVELMKIVVAGLPWAFTVEPTATSSPFVTVLDVLHTLYTGLHKPIKQAEFVAVSKSYRDSISVGWYNRLDKISSPSDMKAERARGVRRIDYLLGKTCIKRLRYLNISGQGVVTWLVDFGT